MGVGQAGTSLSQPYSRGPDPPRMAAQAARPVGITSLWVFKEAAAHPTCQPILPLIKFCLCSPVLCRL